MNINDLKPEYINKKRYRSLAASRRKLYKNPGAAWIQGFDAAIRLAKQVANANCICEHCGKLLISDIRFDADFTPLCPKCYDKLFKLPMQTMSISIPPREATSSVSEDGNIISVAGVDGVVKVTIKKGGEE